MKAFWIVPSCGVTLVSAFSYDDFPHQLPDSKHPPEAPGWPMGNWYWSKNHPLWNIGVCYKYKPWKSSKKPRSGGYCVAYDAERDKDLTYKCGMGDVKVLGRCRKNGDPCYAPAFTIGEYRDFCYEEGYAPVAEKRAIRKVRSHPKWNDIMGNGTEYIKSFDAAPENDGGHAGIEGRGDKGGGDGAADDDESDDDSDDDSDSEGEGVERSGKGNLVRRNRVHHKRARCSLLLKEDPVPGKCGGT